MKVGYQDRPGTVTVLEGWSPGNRTDPGEGPYGKGEEIHTNRGVKRPESSPQWRSFSGRV